MTTIQNLQSFNKELASAVIMVNNNNKLHREIKSEAAQLHSISIEKFSQKIPSLINLLQTNTQLLTDTNNKIKKLVSYANQNQDKFKGKTLQKVKRLFSKTQTLIMGYKGFLQINREFIVFCYKEYSISKTPALKEMKTTE